MIGLAWSAQDLARTALPKSPLGDAVRYLTNQWTLLHQFVEDGRLAIDNNRAENQLRVVAVGRRNWLFGGSLGRAHRGALLYSVVQSCTLVDVPPFEYLKDALLRVVGKIRLICKDGQQSLRAGYARPEDTGGLLPAHSQGPRVL